MNKKFNATFFLLTLCIFSGLAFSQPTLTFDSQTITAKETKCNFGLLLDFNGDELEDFLFPPSNPCQIFNRRPEFLISGPHTLSSFAGRFGRRNWVRINSDENIIKFDSLFAVLRSKHTNTQEEPIFFLTNNELRLARYANIPGQAAFDNFELTLWTLDYQPDLQPVEIALGNYSGTDEADLLVLLTNGSENQLQVYTDVFTKPPESVLAPSETLTFPFSLPITLFSGTINNDAYDDIIFQTDQKWVMWFSSPSSQSAFLQSDSNVQSVELDVPSEIQSITQVLFPQYGFPMLVSVKTQSESNMAYAIIQPDNLENPNFVNLPGKNQIGVKSQLFWFRSRQNPTLQQPVLTVEDERTREQALINDRIGIYTIQKDGIDAPTKVKTLTGRDIQENFHVLRVLGTGDYDGDDTSDLVLGGFVPFVQQEGFESQIIAIQGQIKSSNVQNYKNYP